MKKVLIVALTLALVAIMVIPASAAGRGPGGGNGKGTGYARNGFTLVGTIASFDPAAGAVGVTILQGSKPAQSFVGQTITVQTTSTTSYMLRNPDGTCTAASAVDLKVGQNVSISGSLVNTVWTAQRITIGAQLIHQP